MRGARGLSPRGARVFLAVLSDPRPKGSGSISCAVREKRGARVILFTAAFGTCGAVQIFDLGNSSHTEERREPSPGMELPCKAEDLQTDLKRIILFHDARKGVILR